MPKTLVTIICFLLAIGIAVGLIWPKYRQLKILEVDIIQKESELEARKEYLNNLKAISLELEKYQDDFSKINSALPSGQSTPSLFDFIQKTSSQTGLILSNIASVSVVSVSGSNLKEMKFSIYLSGSYSAFKNFLSLLENSARLIEIENISFVSPQENELFSFDLGIKVYSY